ncbi:helix-turn-helix domain-containing protein [Vagococcus carniphilus]|uniref:Helix-turn-helix domain-containing protein n=1 Tax=Vagococcus carniphilus TaxID=218144 RepID=A0AAW8U3X4_9ENTE|nr:helix-turn-helix domain-containing protein [Vagococcus carniphilus]MDT2832509.1 helix-turn-helix domain-containing protein [Vagococcus carniphilus]
MNEGELFRKLKKDRGFSLEQVSDEINSISFISKFEKGQSNISFLRFERLLQNVNVSMEEFLYLRALEDNPFLNDDIKVLRGYLTSDFYYYLARLLNINKCSEKNEFEKGIVEMKLVKEEMDHAINWQRFVGIFCDICIVMYESNILQRDDANSGETAEALMKEINYLSKPVVSYLYKVEDWGVFEVALFKLFLFTFKVEQINQLLPIAISRTQKESEFHVMATFKIEIIFSSFSYFANFRHKKWAREALEMARDLLRDEKDLMNSTMLLFYEGWYQIIFEEKDKGIEKCFQAISIFNILDQPTFQKRFKLFLENILKNKEEPDNYFMFV